MSDKSHTTAARCKVERDYPNVWYALQLHPSSGKVGGLRTFLISAQSIFGADT
jgi:hypothetical protein